MAELFLKIGAGSNYEDGDILCAFNNCRIRCAHAQHICKLDGFNSNGFRVPDCLADIFQQRTYQFKFERVSAKEIRRITLATMDEEILNDKLNAKGEAIDVPLYITYAIKHNKHRIFGTTGHEYWYGGNVNYSNDILTDIWHEIESKTSFREVDYPLWPAGKEDLKQHFGIRVNDFDDSVANFYVESIIDNKDERNPVIIKKRKNFVDRENLSLPAAVKDKITDKSISVDIRNDYIFTVPAIVQEKVV